MTREARLLLAQPLRDVRSLQRGDIDTRPGVYAWYRKGELFYVGESRRGLRSRIWGNHLRGNARSSTLRNKVARAFGFLERGYRAYGSKAEEQITEKLEECSMRFLVVAPDRIPLVQADLIARLDPPLNDHPGQAPRWRIDDVRAILEIEPHFGGSTGAPTH